ncbi:MAG: cupin domain-containing protein, partial [Deltaproteobacteria bacterium]|nr:cupin domain-containing protein [Deltaproteobacteria bacterium]
VNDQVYHLKAGDSITLRSSSPHKVANRGKNEAVAVWVASEPLFFSTK